MKDSEQRGFSFWIGVFLVAVSFGIYPTYPTIAMLPISAEAKVASGVAGWSLSWLLFAVGSLLAGSAGRALLLRFFALRRSRDGNQPVAREPRRAAGGVGD
ncbi:MAG: hypothetical protein ACREQ9_08515 [Candidatus Binatia bacterium]